MFQEKLYNLVCLMLIQIFDPITTYSNHKIHLIIIMTHKITEGSYQERTRCMEERERHVNNITNLSEESGLKNGVVSIVCWQLTSALSCCY